MDNRHAFQILEQLGTEAHRLGIKVVDAYGQSGAVTEFLAKIARYIEAREAEIDRLREVNGWVPVSARLPPLDVDVLLHCGDATAIGSVDSDGDWFGAGLAFIDEPSHWMPLPSPPSE